MKNLFLVFLVLTCLKTKAQEVVFRDNTTREPIPNVVIKDKNNVTVSTNNFGKANLSALDNSDSIVALNVGYYPKKFLYTTALNQIGLNSKQIQLSEIIFSANKREEKMIDVPYSINVIKQKEIEFGNQPTSADMLQNTGAVFVQKSQLGGGSPVLRGFEANKVLIVVDGIRMNNAIYRGGHLQDIITLDANMLERTEVIFGPSSTIYGSDALGGVMHFYTKNAEFSTNDNLLVKTNTMARYASASNETTGHLDFNIGSKKIASMTNLTYSAFDDLKSGSTKLNGYSNTWDRNYYVSQYDAISANSNTIVRDTMLQNPNNNVLKGSGYSQIDIMQRFNLKTGEHGLHSLNFQYSESSNINRYDRLTETTSNTVNVNGFTTNRLKFGEWYYGPQKRLLGAYSYNNDKKTLLTDNIKCIAAYQKIDQDRISRNYQNVNRVSQNEDVTVLSVNIDAVKKIKNVHELRYGLEVTANDVKSTAQSSHINTNEIKSAQSRYADGGNQMNTYGGYVSHSWEVSENFVISDGIRFTANTLESNFKDTTFYKFPFTKASQKNQAVTGSLGFTWKEEENYKVSLLINTGFRTPNIDDMSKVFDSNNSILIIPNPEIKPEYASNFELGISKIIDQNYRFDFTAFYTLLENALVQADYKFNGSDSAMFNGSMKKTQAVQNKDRAYIYGVSAGVQFDFNQHVSFKSIINYTYGRYSDVSRDTVVPLDHIPPVFGQTSLIVKQKNFDGEFFVRYNGKKATNDYSNSGEDNARYSADPIKGYMPPWFTVNVRTGYNISAKFRVNVACENITDNRYRVFASGINAPGRNFIISVRMKV